MRLRPARKRASLGDFGRPLPNTVMTHTEHSRRADNRIRFPRTQTWEYLETTHVIVSTCGIPRPFQEAFLNICLTTRRCYLQTFGSKTLGRVEINVTKRAKLHHRLWTNGADRIYLTLSKKSQLDIPQKSGVNNIYGLAHELGHIVLYRSLINIPALPPGWGEGWATFLGSFLAIPHLYSEHGPTLWPYAYDYLTTEGPDRVRDAYARHHNRLKDPCGRVVICLDKLHSTMGHRPFCRFFKRLFASPLTSADFVSQVNEQLRELDLDPPELDSKKPPFQ